MHIKLTRIETLISSVLIFTIIFAIAQIGLLTNNFNKQAHYHQANILYASEMLTYKLNKKADKVSRQQVYEQQLRAEIERRQSINTIDTQNALNTKNLYDKLIVADLVDMQLYTYVRGVLTDSMPILSKGKIGSRWETPAGLYSITTKTENHWSSIAEVTLPYSLPFYGNFFIHGWPTNKDGSDVPAGYSGGCIRLSTPDSRRLFNFADVGTKVLVVNSPDIQSNSVINITGPDPRGISADSYLIANIHTGKIYTQKNIYKKRPIASITKLITSLVSNAVIRYSAKIPIIAGPPIRQSDYRQFYKGVRVRSIDTVYPILMESNNAVAHAVARYYGQYNFLAKMERQVKAIGMDNTSLADASGLSSQNISTARDLFKLARYLYNNSQFLLNVTRLKSQTIYAGGNKYNINNLNHFSDNTSFVGGKTGYTRAAGQTMLSIFNAEIDGEVVTIAIIILGSNKRKDDVSSLYNWFTKYARTQKSQNNIFTKDGITHISNSAL